MKNENAFDRNSRLSLTSRFEAKGSGRRQQNPIPAAAARTNVCVFSSHLFRTSGVLYVPTGVTPEEGHTGFLIHLPPVTIILVLLDYAFENIRYKRQTNDVCLFSATHPLTNRWLETSKDKGTIKQQRRRAGL